MKPASWAALLAAVSLSAAACQGAPEGQRSDRAESSGGSVAKTKELNVEQVSERLAVGEEITLLDVRTREELTTDGAIEGYLHIPIDELEARLAEVPKDKPIVAY